MPLRMPSRTNDWSTTSLRGGIFLVRDLIRSTMSLARSVSFTMQAAASRTSATSGGLFSKKFRAALALLRAVAIGCLIS